MSRRLKVGVVGAGVGASHVESYANLPDLFTIAAICDLDDARREEVARKHGVAKTVGSLDALLALDLDIIDLATPSNLHFAQAMDVLRAGRHVIVEKPLAASLAEADQLAEAAAKAGRQVGPIFQYRFANGLRRFRHLAAKGLVGKAYVATVETHWRRTAAYYDNPWRGRFGKELGGCLVTHAIHAHDILTEALGPIASVFARAATRVNPIETEDCAALVLEMQNGALVTLSVTLGSEVEISRLRFCFEGLTVESSVDPYNPGFEPWRFLTADPAMDARVAAAFADFVPGPERWVGQFAAVHKALSEGGPMPVTIADARRSLELLTAAYWSASTGEAVRLPIGKDHPFYEGWRPLPAATRKGG